MIDNGAVGAVLVIIFVTSGKGHPIMNFQRVFKGRHLLVKVTDSETIQWFLLNLEISVESIVVDPLKVNQVHPKFPIPDFRQLRDGGQTKP